MCETGGPGKKRMVPSRFGVQKKYSEFLGNIPIANQLNELLICVLINLLFHFVVVSIRWTRKVDFI